MAHHVSRGCQTNIQGLCRDPALIPHALTAPTDNASTQASTQAYPLARVPADTHTPPHNDDDMALDKLQISAHGLPAPSPQSHLDGLNSSRIPPSMLLKRKKRPAMVARISMPVSDMGIEDPPSPPPTEAVMSPLPAANKLHAGHTPIIPGALSPLPVSEGLSSPDIDAPLEGPLTLPPQPGDGAGDGTIPLDVLDRRLEELAQEQSANGSYSPAEPEVEPRRDHEDDAALLGRKSSRESRKTPLEETVDGVLLKKPKMNMGAPLGQA